MTALSLLRVGVCALSLAPVIAWGQGRPHLTVGNLDAAANVAPAVDLNGAEAGIDFNATFTPTKGAILIVDGDASDEEALFVSDNTNHLVSATILLTNNLDGAAETLAVTTTGTNIVASLGAAGSSRTLTLTGFDSRAAYTQVLRTATYNNTASSPNTTQRVIEFRLNDGRLQSAAATSRVTIIPRLTLQTAASRKSHGAPGAFDIDLPLSGSPGIEPRNAAAGNGHTLVFVFSNNVLSGSAAVTSGTGTVSGSPSFNGKAMTVQLTGVSNVQQIAVTLSNVTDNTGQVLPNTVIAMKVLRGDVNGDSAVNAGDAQVTRTRSGQTTAFANFRSDVNLDANINSGDALIVRAASGTGL